MGNSESEIAVHNQQVLRSLNVGDRIKFRRGVYSHWGIYYGDGKVIHLTGINEGHIQSRPEHSFTISGQRFPKATVKIDDFFHVCDGKKAYKNNNIDKYKSPCDPVVIIERAMEYLGRIVPYNLFGSNCEHFATWCRNTLFHSQQVQDLAVGGGVTATAVTTAGIVATVLAIVLPRR